ncbi:hypothetical protein ANDO1_1724 [plant metagenome]|uniref:Uncharacterized protein n=1 Tax=plant metagenome TaxID=1297885 RepID=A0A484P3A3_9ZZZZ
MLRILEALHHQIELAINARNSTIHAGFHGFNLGVELWAGNVFHMVIVVPHCCWHNRGLDYFSNFGLKLG